MRLRLFADEVVAVVLCVVDEDTSCWIDPIIGHDAVRGWICARHERGVPHRRLGIGVPVVGVGVVHALIQQVPEAASSESIPVASGQITA